MKFPKFEIREILAEIVCLSGRLFIRAGKSSVNETEESVNEQQKPLVFEFYNETE